MWLLAFKHEDKGLFTGALNLLKVLFYGFNFKWNICTPEQLQCVKDVPVSENDCLNKCDGLIIKGFDRREFEQNQVDEIFAKVKDDYEKYKSGANLKLPASVGGNYYSSFLSS